MAAETEVERLVVRLVGEGSSYQQMLQQAASRSVTAAREVEQATLRIQGMTQGIQFFGSSALGAISSVLGGITLLGAAFKAVNLAAEAEKNTISFGVMLQSVEAGTKLVKDLQQFAAATPLNTRDIQAAAKVLLQFGVEGKEVINIMRQLGDVTGGDAQRFSQIALAFGQMSASGKLMGQDLLQMINAGFNPLKEISRTTGKSVAQLKAEMEKGQVTTEMVAGAFKTATSQGGAFFNLMEKQSKSFSGLLSTMQDDIDSFLRILGEDIIQGLGLKELMKGVSAFAQQATAALQSISPEVKRIAAIVATITAAVGVAAGAWVLLGGFITSTFATIGAVVGAVFSPLGLAIGAITAAVALLGTAMVENFGGWAKVWENIQAAAVQAWEAIQKAAADFWEWAKPIVKALQFLWQTTWSLIRQAAQATWDAAVAGLRYLQRQFSALLASMGLDSKATWDGIRENIISAIIAAEFALQNLGQVLQFVWVGAKLAFVSFGNDVTHFFTVVIPHVYAAYVKLSENVSRAAVGYLVGAFLILPNVIPAILASIPWGALLEGLRNAVARGIGSTVDAFRNLPALVAGTTKFDDIWRPEQAVDGAKGLAGRIRDTLEAEFEKTKQAMANPFAGVDLTIPQREMGALEKQLRDEYDRLGKTLGESYAEFAARRRKELGMMADNVLPPGTAEQAAKDSQKAGEKIGGAMVGGAKREVEKLEAVLARSASASARMREYLDRLEEMGSGRKRRSGPAALSGGAGADEIFTGGPLSDSDLRAAARAVDAVQAFQRRRAAQAPMPSEAPRFGGQIGGAGLGGSVSQGDLGPVARTYPAGERGAGSELLEVLKQIRDDQREQLRRPTVELGAAALT